MAAQLPGGGGTRALAPPPVCWPLLFLIVISCPRSETSADPVIYSGDEKVEPGRPFHISCSVPMDQPLSWTLDDRRLEGRSDYSFHSSEKGGRQVSTLTVLRAEQEHLGEYRCNPLNRLFRILRADGSRPEEEEEGKKEEEDSVDYLRPNQTLRLDCDLGENTRGVRVRWYKNEKPVEDGDVQIDDKVLTIQRGDQADGGEYKCQADSEEDRKKVTYIAKLFPVYTPPGIRLFPPELSFLNGSELTLECRVFGGYPKPKIRWLVGNEAAEHRPGYDDQLLLLPGSQYPDAVLYVRRADYSDRNRYTCIAENSVGRAEESVLVTIRDNMIKTNEEEAGKGLILLPGKELVLQCETTVCINCTVEWLKDGEHVNKSDDRIHIHNANNSLIVNSAEAADSGDYMCFINRTISGEFINATITVRPKTQLELFEKSINLVQGDKLNLHCNVKSGEPLPTIVWYRDGQLINGSDDHLKFVEDDKGIPNAILTIDELEFTDRAHYMCEADNGISSANTTILVRVKDRLAALWPFLGICAEVLILCTIIFVYEKRKVKEVNETDVDRITESINVPERGRSQDIRQRK